MIETSSNQFDNVASQFDIARRAYSPELAETLESFGFVAGTSVLDVGCGTGAATSLLAERGCAMTGVDGSEKMLEVARSRVPQATFVQGTAEALPFAPRSFNGVVSGQTFHLVDQPKALDEAIRVTKPGGRVGIFWKLHFHDEPVAKIRDEAFRELGIQPPPGPLKSGFPTFYGAPFADHALRVVPMMTRASLQAEVAHEGTRVRTIQACGDQLDRFLQTYLAKLCERFGEPSTAVIMRFVQYLYVGTVR